MWNPFGFQSAPSLVGEAERVRSKNSRCHLGPGNALCFPMSRTIPKHFPRHSWSEKPHLRSCQSDLQCAKAFSPAWGPFRFSCHCWWCRPSLGAAVRHVTYILRKLCYVLLCYEMLQYDALCIFMLCDVSTIIRYYSYFLRFIAC